MKTALPGTAFFMLAKQSVTEFAVSGCFCPSPPPLTRAGRMRETVIERLMNAPYGHDIRRDSAGNSHVTLFDGKGKRLHTIVAPTFDEAVTRALDLADGEGGTDA